MTSCPKCNSTHLQKKGMRGNKQRYKCMECKTCFTEGVDYKPQNKYDEKLDLTCPICNSSNIMRDGKLEDGSQRYICGDCRKRFSEKTNRDLKKIEWKCPYCGGELGYAGYGKLGQHRYKCKSCGKDCSSKDNTQPTIHTTFEDTNTSIICVACGSKRIKSAGMLGGERRYICKECGKAFTENSKSTPKATFHKSSDVETAVKLVLNGVSKEEVCKKFNFNRRGLTNHIWNYCMKNKLWLTEKDKELVNLCLNKMELPQESVIVLLNKPIYICKKYIEKNKRNKKNVRNFKSKTVIRKRKTLPIKEDIVELNRFIPKETIIIRG